MRKIFFLFLTLFITACSSTKIHVYTVGVDQHTQRQLLQSLNTAGFRAHQKTIPLPPLKEGAYIIFTPGSRSTHVNQQIEQILESLNLPAPESRLFSLGEGISAHRYTKGNVGLYVINNTAQQTDSLKKFLDESSILDWELGSVNCSESYIVDFMGDGKSYISQLEDGKEISSLNWKIHNKKLILTTAFKRYVYDISEADKTITPSQQYPEPYGCQFRSNFETTVHVKP